MGVTITRGPLKTFLLPRNGTQPERFYSFGHGDAHFTVLDSNSCCDATQRSWLETDLATTVRKSYPVPRSNIPVTATFVLDSPAGQCGAATFPGPPPAPSCRFNTTGSTLSCK